jgi:7-carboxy-7-deazaguanine synthase
VRRVAPGLAWVLLTGGEPAEQELGPLVDALHGKGFKVALETSGTAPGWRGAAIDWFCLSPKLGMPGGRAILRDAIDRADEIKMPVGRTQDVDNLAVLLALRTTPGVTPCLQPLSANPKATALCVEECLRRGWRLSVQTHKALGVR